MQTVAVRDVQPGSESSPVQTGDRVEVETRDHEKLDFTVTDITDDGLAGQFGFVRFDDIHTLRVRRPGQTDGSATKWLLGILGAAAAIALIVSADSVTACSGTPCPPPQ